MTDQVTAEKKKSNVPLWIAAIFSGLAVIGYMAYKILKKLRRKKRKVKRKQQRNRKKGMTRRQWSRRRKGIRHRSPK